MSYISFPRFINIKKESKMEKTEILGLAMAVIFFALSLSLLVKHIMYVGLKKELAEEIELRKIYQENYLRLRDKEMSQKCASSTTA